MMTTLSYYLELDDYLSDLNGEDRYDVVQQFVAAGDELATYVEYENCTLEHARTLLARLYKAKPPEGVVQP